MAKLVTNMEENTEEKSVDMKIHSDFSELMDGSWRNPELAFLHDMPYKNAKDWYEK